MNVNFGLFPPIDVEREPGAKRLRGNEKSVEKKRWMSRRALVDFSRWMDETKAT
jgi:methylenetetrahydrofolate--tRNA-(uracil-5-)-methyltransferase